MIPVNSVMGTCLIEMKHLHARSPSSVTVEIPMRRLVFIWPRLSRFQIAIPGGSWPVASGKHALISKARPRLGDGQETRLYDVMEELGDGPVTLDQIVKQCEYRRYGSLLRTEPSIRDSVEWHLRDWLKRDIVKKTPTSSQ